MALIVTDPREEQTPWIVIVAPCHFTSLMQTLQSRPSKGITRGGLAFLPRAGIKHEAAAKSRMLLVSPQLVQTPGTVHEDVLQGCGFPHAARACMS